MLQIHRSIVRASLLAAFLPMPVAIVRAEVLINQGTTIDYPINGQNVRVVDGALMPTHVDLVAPAYIEQAVSVFGGSSVEMLGGTIVGGLGLHDSASALVNGGLINLGVFSNDFSVVNITAGQISGEINAQGQS